MANLDTTGQLLLVLGALMAAIAVSLFVWIGLHRVRQRLTAAMDRYDASLARSEERMGRLARVGQGNESFVVATRALRARAFSISTALLLAILALVLVIAGRQAIAAYLLAAFVALPFIGARIVDWSTARTRRKIERALPSAIGILAGGMAAGLSMQGALATVATNLKGPMATIARSAANAIAAGRGTRGALLDMAHQSGSRYVSLFAHVTAVHLERGGNLAQALRELGSALTLIHIAEDELMAKTAGARRAATHAMLIIPGTLVMGVVFFPEMFGALTNTAMGQAILIGGTVAMGFCIYKLRQITDREV